MQMKNILRSLLLAAVLPLGSMTAFTQTGPTSSEPDDLHAVIETLRSDVDAFKIRTLNQALQLTGPETEKFWPVYRQYRKSWPRWPTRRLHCREFGERSPTVPSTTRPRTRWQSNGSRTCRAAWICGRSHKKMAKAVSPARAAQFLQVEHQMGLFMDLNIAAEMPALRAVIKTGKP